MTPKEMFTCFLWQRRNSGLCVPWLTFSKLGDCVGWLLIPEKDFFLRKPESVLPASFFLIASGADDFLADALLRAPPGALAGESTSWVLALASVLFIRFSLLGLFYQLVDPQVILLPLLLGLVSFTDTFMILFNLLAEFSAGACVLVCRNSATQSLLCRLAPVREQLLGCKKISTESESEHRKTFRTIRLTFL